MQKKVIVPIGVVMLPVIAASVWSWSASAQSAQNQPGQSGAAAQQNPASDRNRQSDGDRDRSGRANQSGQSGQAGQSGSSVPGLAQSGAGREVTLTGRIMDVQSFFMMPDTSRQLQGAPISPGSSGQSGLDKRGQSSAGADAGSAAGTSGDAARSSGALSSGSSAIESGGAMRGAGQSQVMILQTASGPVLISSERTPGAASQKQLQPGSEEVQIRGRMYEKSGLKFVLVTDHRPGGVGQSGTESRSGTSGAKTGATGGSGSGATGSNQQNR